MPFAMPPGVHYQKNKYDYPQNQKHDRARLSLP
jgi:hypothetical protein